MKASIPHAGTACCHHPAATATALLRQEHEVILRAVRLLERVGADVGAGVDARPALRRLVEFFQIFADRCHHAKEEQHLFPALERRGLPRDVGPVAVMLAEHDLGRRLLATMLGEDTEAAAEAARAYATLLRGHIDKENHVLFPMAEQVLDDEEQRTLRHAFEAVEHDDLGPDVHERLLRELAALERERPGADAQGAALDVRDMAPRDRHPRIFATFDALQPGEMFVLVNDHDPKPLYYQFAAERPEAFTWRYLEEGPETWRVEIGRTR